MASRKGKEPPFTMDPDDAAAGVDVAAPGGDKTALVPLQGMDFDQLQRDGAGTALQTTSKDLAIPFLRVLQSNSPQVDRDNAKFVKGSEAGMFINTVTNRLWDGRDTGILLAVVAYQRNYTEWKPRGEKGQGGGFVKDWGGDDTEYKAATPDPVKKSKMITDHGTEMVQSGNYYVYVVDPETGAFEEAVFPLSGTQLKKSRRWNSLIKSEQLIHPTTKQPFSPPPFFRLYKVTTIPEQNDQGNWKGIKVEPGPTLFEVPNGGLIYQQALNFKTSIDAGEVKVAAPDREFVDDPDPDAKDDDNAPF